MSPDPRNALTRGLLTGFRALPSPLRRLVVRTGTPHFTVGAVVLLYRNDPGEDAVPRGSLLLLEQRHTGRWALPGGLLRRRECPLDAARREVAEETGLDLAPEQLSAATPSAYVDAVARRVDVVFLGRCARDAALHLDGTETIGAQWVGPDDPLPDCTAATLDVLGACGMRAP